MCLLLAPSAKTREPVYPQFVLKSDKYRWCQGCVVFSPETDATLVLKNLNVGLRRASQSPTYFRPKCSGQIVYRNVLLLRAILKRSIMIIIKKVSSKNYTQFSVHQST